MKIEVHPDRCISAGLCVGRMPDVFDQREEDGTVLLKVDEVLDDDEIRGVSEAAMVCPSGAIEVHPA